MPSGPVLSEADKQQLRERFEALCEERWISYGYKKTNIKELCAAVGVGIGTFYKLYGTKEKLFIAVFTGVNDRLSAAILRTVKANPSKEGITLAIREMFREYDSKPALYDTNTADYQSLASKLPDADVERLKANNLATLRQWIEAAELEPQIDIGQAYGVLIALLAMLQKKDRIENVCDLYDLFDFMADTMVKAIFK